MKPAPGSGVVVGIIGGLGRMGRWLESRLTKAGCRVLIADASLGPVRPEMAAGCQVLMLAVPARAVEEVMAQVGPWTRPDGLVMDITSLKAVPLASMLAHARGEVVGCHPLFGPGARSARGQAVFVCPGRGERWLRWVEEFWGREGARVARIEPERHDRLMARVQSLRHLLLYGLGGALKDLGFTAEDLDLAGPWFQGLMDILKHQARQPAGLYAELALGNPHAPAALAALLANLDKLAQRLEQGDRQGLEELCASAGQWARELEAAAPDSDSSPPEDKISLTPAPTGGIQYTKQQR